jgi:enoyl-CoA hydratase/carnithine racemase
LEKQTKACELVKTIAALHGVAFGAGFQLALEADIRLASTDTTMSIIEIKWGLISDMSATQTLKYLVRIDIAKELMFTGRVIHAQEALEIGLVTKISDKPMEDALTMAELIASKSPDAISSRKKLLNTAWNADELTGFKMEKELQVNLLKSKNHVEPLLPMLKVECLTLTIAGSAFTCLSS